MPQGLLSIIVVYARDFLNVVLALFQWSNPGVYSKLFWHPEPSITLSPGLVVTLKSVVKFSNGLSNQQVIIQKWRSRPCSVLSGKKVSRAWGDWLTARAKIIFSSLPSEAKKGTERKRRILHPQLQLNTLSKDLCQTSGSKRVPRVFKFVPIVIHFYPRHSHPSLLPKALLSFV